MLIAIVLYDGMAALDAIGPYEVLGRLPDTTVTFVATEPGPIRSTPGSLELVADAALDQVPDPDVVLVPGGTGQLNLPPDGPIDRWLAKVDQTTQWTTAVCTGSLVLGSAGLLTGRRATTHWLARDDLAAYGAEVVAERVVFDGKYVTTAGVSAGIDMALALAGRIAGDRVAESIQLKIEYDPQPPYQSGSPDVAATDIVDEVRAASPRGRAGRRTA